jgi:hypothetical protein
MIITVYCLAFAALAALAAWCAATRWWHYLVRYLPEGTFSEGSSGKDEIVLASIYSTFMLAFIVAALALWAIRVGWRLAKR